MQGLQWVLSGYLLTYGGFMLLGGRAADLLGRRRVLVAGTVVFALSSLVGGFAGDAGVLVAARLAQGVGAAMMLPAALSILTTSFTEGRDRNKALGVWGGVGGLASAAGVLLGGVLTEGPGWRWVLFVNPPVCAARARRDLPVDRRRARRAPARRLRRARRRARHRRDAAARLRAGEGARVGLGLRRGRSPSSSARSCCSPRSCVNEQRSRNPLLPLSIFRDQRARPRPT